MIQAQKIWLKDDNGPLFHHYKFLLARFLKFSILQNSKKFKALDAEIHKYLSQSLIPLFKIVVSIPILLLVFSMVTDKAYFS